MDEISDRIALLGDSVDELDQAKVFPLQFKITLTTYFDFRGELLALIGGHKRAKFAQKDIFQQLSLKENEVHKIGRDIFSMCEEYEQEVGEGILEHYNKEMERTDEKY